MQQYVDPVSITDLIDCTVIWEDEASRKVSHLKLADSIQETIVHGRKTRKMSTEGEGEERMGLLPPDWMAHAQASVLMVRYPPLVVWGGGS